MNENENKNDNIENAYTNNSSKKGKNIKKISIILAIIAISIVTIITAIIIFTKNNNSTQSLKNKESQKLHSFFIKDSNNNYALYNSKGKQLTEFDFQKVGDFYNEVTVVNKDNKYAIINENGNIIVGYDAYKEIKQYTFMFFGTKNDGTKEVIDYKGKVWDGYQIGDKSTENVVCLLKENSIEIINSELKNVATLPRTSASTYITIQEKDNYAYIYQNETGYLIDMSKKDKYLKFDKKYYLDVIDTKQNAVILADVNVKLVGQNINEILVIKDLNIIYKNNEEFRTDASRNITSTNFMDNYVYINTIKKLICLSNGNETDFSKYTSVSFITPDTYVAIANETAEFFVNSKLVNKIDKLPEVNSLYNGYYGRKLVYLKEWYLYKKDGTLLNDKKYADVLNQVDNYTALQDYESKKYYIVDKNLNKVTEEYWSVKEQIATVGKNEFEYYFAVYPNDKKSLKIIDKNLKTVFEYNSTDNNILYIDLTMHYGQLYVSIRFTTSKIEVYNANTNKLVSDVDSTWNANTNYYTVKKGDTVTYHSYIGDKAFYTK